MADKRSFTGGLWSLASAFLWSTTFVGARFLMENDCIDPVTLTVIRFFTGGILLLITGTFIQKKKMYEVTAKEMLYMAMLAFFGMPGMSVLLFYGQQTTTATNTALLMQLSPIFTVLLGAFAGIRIKKGNIIGVILSFAGCLAVMEIIGLSGVKYSFENNKGDLLLIGSALSWSVYTLLAKPIVDKLGGLKSTTWIMLFGALETLLLRLLLPVDFLFTNKGYVWALVLYIAVFPTALAFLAYLEAMDRINIILLNIMQYLTPFFTIVLAAMLLGEKFGFSQGIGFLLILVGIYISEKKRPSGFKHRVALKE